MSSRLITINGAALRKELQMRGLNQSEAGRAIYKSDSYFAKVISRNAIQKGDVKHIQDKFNIDPDAYVVRDEEQIQIPTNDKTPEITITPQINAEQWQRIEDIIYNAIKRALHE